MKSRLLHFFAVFMAILIAIPIANAAPEDYKLNVNTTPKVTYAADWYSTIWDSKMNAMQMVVSNDVAYTIMPGSNKVSYYNYSDNTSGALESGETTANNCGWGIACDDAGNIIYAKGSNFIKKSSKIAIIPSSGASGKVVDINKQVAIDLTNVYTASLGTTNDRADHWFASGNCLSSEGGYLWFAVPTKIVRIKFVNGSPDGQEIFTVSPAIPTLGQDTRTSIFPYANGKYLLQASGTEANIGYIYDCTLNGSVFNLTLIQKNRFHSADIDFLREHKIMVRNANEDEKVKDGKIEVFDMTMQSSLASFWSYNGATSAGYGNVNSWNVLQKVSDDEMALYTYVPQSGFSKYTITAIANFITNANASLVENSNNIKVTWTAPAYTAPAKYRVSYTTDAGSSWILVNENVTTTEYTVENINIGSTYEFKVEPYYSVSASWGQEVKTNSVATVDPTTPVSGVTASIVADSFNNVTVSWTKPTGANPSKYAVSYSIEGSNAWSTAVETTDLSYTFNEPPTATYLFKVVPYYSNSWGEELISSPLAVEAANSLIFTTTKRWEVKGTTETCDQYDGRGIGVSNNNLYIIDPKHKTTISYVNQNTSAGNWSEFESGFSLQNLGYAMDNDDAGNIIVKSGNYFGSAATQLTIYPAGATSNANKKEITLSDDYLPGARADFIAAQGNLLSAEGGYVWIAPNTGYKIMRIKIVNGALAGVDTWTHSLGTSSNSNQILLRPLSDGRLYMHFRGTGYYIIDLPSVGEAITSSMMQNITVPKTDYSYNPISLVNSGMFVLQGHTFHVRNDGAQDESIGIVIKNLTEEGNGDASFTPFDGVNAAGEESGVSDITGYGSLVRAVKVDDYNYDVYCYSINHGVTVYRVSAQQAVIKTGAITDLAYSYAKEDSQQNITLTWNAPTEATPSSYKIYRDGSLLATVDASTLTYTDKGVSKNYTYRVVPIFTGVDENDELGLEVTTSGIEALLYAPVITEKRSYDGYSITQLFFAMPDGNKVRPASFNIYRNGALLESGVTAYNYIDDNLPKILKDEAESVTYNYTVEAVYSSSYNNATRMSEPTDVVVTARNEALASYKVQELYNVPITQSSIGNWQNLLDDNEYYRQGHFYDGHWYIAQLSDTQSSKDQGVSGGAINKSEIAGATGGVIAIKATEEIDVRNGVVGKVITSDEFASAGLAIDDKGTIFMRHNNLEQLKATIPSDATWYSGMYDAYDRRITEGALYTRNDDGSYSTTPTIVDLSQLWTSDDWINNMYYTGLPSYGQVIGRSDYFNMYGDVMGAEGGYLILSPSWTRTVFKVKIVNGVYDSHETLEFTDYTEGDVTHKVLTGTENYGFEIAGRDAWMAQIRSNAYFGIHGVSEDHQGEEHDHEWHAIYDTDSRVNNSGGTSIVAFDNTATDINDGETFLITPVNMYSHNQGDFIVTRGIKENIGDAAADSKLAPPMPVAQFKQTELSNSATTFANGNWFHAEIGTYENAQGTEQECVYIYQYVPGVRFAKYRLYSDQGFPVVYPSLEITTAYNDENTEITHFSGVAKWKRPSGFGEENAANANVKIESYTFELLDAKGEVIYTGIVPEQYDEDGNPPSEDFEYTFDYCSNDEIIAAGKAQTLDAQTYTARVAVNYKFVNGTTHQSSFNTAIADNDYPAEPATNLGVWVFKQNDRTSGEWVEKDGEWVVESKLVDAYRMEIDFSKPNFDEWDSEEPVSNYTIYAVPTINGVETEDIIPITGFELHKGSEEVNGVTKAVYEIADQVPGTYGFDEDKAPYYSTGKWSGGESRRNVVLTWHHTVDNGTYNEEAVNTRSVQYDEPHMWSYYVAANYADNNQYIRKSTEAVVGADADEGLIETGVEVIGSDNASSLQIYPIPASTSITVKSGEAINSIVIYNESGAEVMNLKGDGDTVTNVNVENLVAGFYFVKVNNQAPVKIIKK